MSDLAARMARYPERRKRSAAEADRIEADGKNPNEAEPATSTLAAKMTRYADRERRKARTPISQPIDENET